jgi:phosphoglucosamine mutase
MIETGKPLSELKKCLSKYPQAQRNLKVREKIPVEELSGVSTLVAETERELAGAGRVLLRYSGTEPKIRLLIEGRHGDRINAQADKIAGLIESQIGI